MLLLTAAAGALVAQPTVDGLFYGDGDDALYIEWNESYYGSKLYIYYDVPTTTLYSALVVDRSVNDNVFTSRPPDSNAYMLSAGWGGGGGQQRGADRLTDSEFASFLLECAPGGGERYEWQQGYACSKTAGPPPSTWVSDLTCPASLIITDTTGQLANILTSSSSFAMNANTYQTAPAPPVFWNMYLYGTALDRWKSPFDAVNPNDVTILDGYPPPIDPTDLSQGPQITYSDDHEWEWSMVYEWSMDLAAAGCGNEPIFLVTGSSHHSPMKTGVEGDFDLICGEENDCFPPNSSNPISDWGDLPDTYLTLEASGGPRHVIKVTGPYLGPNLQTEGDGVPTSDASGDGSEEDGVTFNVTGNWTAGSTQTVTVVVSRAPAGGATLGAWFDWNNDGDLADAGEFFSWTGLATGTHDLTITVGASFDWQTDDLYSRFRLFSSGTEAPGGSLDQADSAGEGQDGEVEDYHFAPGGLPVTLNAFSSERTGGREVTVRWQTASETDNVGFEIWGRVAGEWRVLSDFVESRAGTTALPQSYETRIEAPARLSAIQLVDYDSRGRPERFGSFRIGKSYGEVQPTQTIDWSVPRAEREERLRERGFGDTARGRRAAVELPGQRRDGSETSRSARWKKLSGETAGAAAAGRSGGASLFVPVRGRSGGSSSESAVPFATESQTHVAVTETGIQRVTYEALRDGGLDLAGVNPRDVAVTWRGEPVARWIDGGVFGPGSAIEFLGRAPRGEDALYLDANLYQVSVDRSSAHHAGLLGKGSARSASPWYIEESLVDPPRIYHHQSPTGDPWIETTVLARRGRPPVVVRLDLPVENPVADARAELVVGLGTITDLRDLRDAGGHVLPEHNVEVWLRRPDGSLLHAAEASTSGQRDWRIEATLPRGALQPGLNQVELRFSTEYFYSLVVVDRWGVRYPTPYLGPSLDFAPDRRAAGYHIDGFGQPSVSAYAEGADGSLTRLGARVIRSGAGWAAELRQVDAERIWVTEAPHAPAAFTTEAPRDLLSDPGDLVVLAAPSFVGSRALDDYLAQRADLDPVVIDVEDIYNAVGFGMALPSAITDYLAVRDTFHPFTHVQLVGADCYDRRGYVSDCVSFLPLPSARVGASFYSPSQNRLVDLDGDGIGDKAVAQFSVRDESELATIVAKGEEWEASGLAAGGSALLIAEETDGLHDFAAQVERLRQRLGWSDTDILRMSEHPSVETARQAMRSSLEAGRSVTTFSGHSSPTVWAYRALLTSAGVAELTNEGRPTIMVPLACETTYDISPNANVLGHQLLFDGEQGALAISGAAALANLAHNERMASHVLEGLEAGLSLGEAVLAGRRALGSAFQELQDNWLTQGDVAVGLDR